MCLCSSGTYHAYNLTSSLFFTFPISSVTGEKEFTKCRTTHQCKFKDSVMILIVNKMLININFAFTTLFPSLPPPVLLLPSLLPSPTSSPPTNTIHSPPCPSFKRESIKHYKLSSTSHMVSDSSAPRREGRVPDSHSNVLQWDNSSAVPTGGQCNATHGGHCPWNGVPGDCISLQPGWNQYN